MNKALHVFVYLFLIGVGFAFYCQMPLHDKMVESKDRSRVLVDGIMDFAASATIEEDTYENVGLPVIPVDKDEPTDHTKKNPNMRNALDGAIKMVYDPSLSKKDHKMLTLSDKDREALRTPYVLDGDGKPVMDGADPQTRNSPAAQVLARMKKAIDNQHQQLQRTRDAIQPLVDEIANLSTNYNTVVEQLRVKIEDNLKKQESIETLTSEKAELSTELSSTKDKLASTEEERKNACEQRDAALRDVEEREDQLKQKDEQIAAYQKKIQELHNERQNLLVRSTVTADVPGVSGAVGQSLPFGDKGKVLKVNTEFMFAIVELTPEAMKELKGEDLSRPMPIIPLAVRRPGFKGPANDLVGRVRLHQEVAGKNYVRCDILSDWAQTEMKEGDVLFAE